MFTKNRVFVVCISLFCLIYLLQPQKYIEGQTNNKIETINKENDELQANSAFINKENKNNVIDTNISIPNEIIFQLATNYIKSSIDEKIPYKLHLTSSKNAIHTTLDMEIFKSNILVAFDIKINSIKNNTLSIYISNLSIGNIKVSNKIAKPLISHISKDKLLVSNNKSNIEIKINLDDVLSKNISISNISIDEASTHLRIKIKV